jgi:DNA invertase Pin-like site-specific DNA recombinase
MLIPYIRRSRKGEDEVSLADQKQAITEWAERNDVELAKWVEDKGVSGAKPWQERELGKIIERLDRGEGEGVIVAYFSRLSREKHSYTFQVLEALQPYRRVDAKKGRIVEPNSEIDLVDVIETWQARDEWTTLKKHLTSGKHKQWERGTIVGDRVPAGYEKTEVVNDKGETKLNGPLRKMKYAEDVGRAITVRANGASWSDVMRLLNAAGVPTCKGSTEWSTQACRKLAQNRIYKGELHCTCGCGEMRVLNELAVVTPSVWKKVQPKQQVGEDGEIIKGKAGRRDPGKYLLAGLLTCAGCQYRMIHSTTTVNGKRYHIYRCGNSKCTEKASISSLQIEPFMQEQALWFFMQTEPSVGHQSTVERLAELERARDEARARLAALVKIIDPLDPGADERLAEMRSAVQDAEAALVAEGSAQIEYVSEEQVVGAFESAPVAEQRRAIRTILHGAIVTKGSGKPEDRVEVVPRTLVWK